MAAGRSFRLKPIEDKNFLKFLGKSLLDHQLDFMNQAGFDEFIVIGGAHNLDDLRDLAQSSKYKITVLEQKKLDEGMAGAVLTAKQVIKEDDEMLIISGNDVVETKAYELVKAVSGDLNWQGAMIGKKLEEYFPGGYLEVNEEHRILEIIEKPEPGSEPSDMVNLVIHYYRHPHKLFEYLEKVSSDRDDKYEVAVSNMINEGAQIKALPYDGHWQALKYPWHVKKIFDFLISQSEARVSNKAQIALSAKLNGHVIIEDGVKVFDNAVVQGPAYIGKNSVVANNALVRDSQIGDNCVVGYTTEIARSVLGDEVWTHSNYVGDSVIGNNVSFGAGTVTGNLRLDEKNIEVKIKGEKIDTGTPKFGLVTGDRVRVGVNTSFMPGVKIGSDSFIGGGIVIGEDVPEKKYVYGKFELKMKDNRARVNEETREQFKKGLK